MPAFGAALERIRRLQAKAYLLIEERHPGRPQFPLPLPGPLLLTAAWRSDGVTVHSRAAESQIDAQRPSRERAGRRGPEVFLGESGRSEAPWNGSLP
jgi:hypothetical protein